MNLTPIRVSLMLAASLAASLGSATVYVAAATDTATCLGEKATVVGTDRGEDVIGTEQRDVIAALGGQDYVAGLEGDDVICAGPGRDFVEAGEGNDRLAGGRGLDVVVIGWVGESTVNLTRERTSGGVGQDRLSSMEDISVADCFSSSHVLIGDAGDNSLYGGESADTIRGRGGDDSIGGDGRVPYAEDCRSGADDRIYGGTGNDGIDGWWGRDYIDGGRGFDKAASGDESDTCISIEESFDC